MWRQKIVTAIPYNSATGCNDYDSDNSAWNLTNDNFGALDYGVDCRTEVDRMREIPYELFEFINDTLHATYQQDYL